MSVKSLLANGGPVPGYVSPKAELMLLLGLRRQICVVSQWSV